MTKVQEMKKIIKPLVKECIKEILYEEGVMKLVQENIHKQNIIPHKEVSQENYISKERQFMEKNTQNPKISLQEAKKKLLKEIAMTGFDPFAGTLPVDDNSSEENQINGEDLLPESKVLPGIQGSGIDISRLMGANKKSWNFYNNALKNGKKED